MSFCQAKDAATAPEVWGRMGHAGSARVSGMVPEREFLSSGRPQHVLAPSSVPARSMDSEPYGYDVRSRFDLPVGRGTRSPSRAPGRCGQPSREVNRIDVSAA